MLIGPKLQRDLTIVLMQWCQYCYVFTADIIKMYRQILVDSRDTNYQRIVWQATSDGPIIDYRFLTAYLRHSHRSLLSPSGLRTTRRRWRCRISARGSHFTSPDICWWLRFWRRRSDSYSSNTRSINQITKERTKAFAFEKNGRATSPFYCPSSIPRIMI